MEVGENESGQTWISNLSIVRERGRAKEKEEEARSLTSSRPLPPAYLFVNGTCRMGDNLAIMLIDVVTHFCCLLLFGTAISHPYLSALSPYHSSLSPFHTGSNDEL